MDLLVGASIVVPLAVLSVVVWWFFKAARRFDAEQTPRPDDSREPSTKSESG
jgi:hypothetical protein